jgi:hypothetical protein
VLWGTSIQRLGISINSFEVHFNGQGIVTSDAVNRPYEDVEFSIEWNPPDVETGTQQLKHAFPFRRRQVNPCTWHKLHQPCRISLLFPQSACPNVPKPTMISPSASYVLIIPLPWISNLLTPTHQRITHLTAKASWREVCCTSQKCRVPSEPLELVLYTMGCTFVWFSCSPVLFWAYFARFGRRWVDCVGFLRGYTGRKYRMPPKRVNVVLHAPRAQNPLLLYDCPLFCFDSARIKVKPFCNTINLYTQRILVS